MGYRTYTCPIARSCGGCEWLAVPYPIQLRRKQEWVERLFEQVIFLLRDDAGAVSDDELLRQANEAAEEYLRPLIPERKTKHWLLPLLVLAGMSLGFGLGVLIGI